MRVPFTMASLRGSVRSLGTSELDELQLLRDEVARLREENGQLRAILYQIPLAILFKDRDGRYLYVNPAGATGYGIPAHELVGRYERDVMPAGNPIEEYLAQDREVIDTGRPAVLPEYTFRAFDGKVQTLYISKFPVDFAGQKAVMITVFDLSRVREIMAERSKLERKVLETQRLESLGVMAGGIAHDFNNLLVGVMANADLALAKTATGSDAVRYLDRVKAAAQRLAALSRQMLAYSGRGRFESELIDLATVTDELLQLLEASISKSVNVQMALGAGLPLVHVDPAQIRQVIMNLITNAAEAIGARTGTVHVSAVSGRFDPAAYPKLTLGAELVAGEYVCLTVQDDGEGMSKRTLKHLFDPFFTTKASGRGLGLAAVLGIVRAHQGALEVLSKEGEGTTFRVWLPVAPRTQRDAQTRPLTTIEAPDRQVGKRVLVVDDERVVREAASAVLEAYGFSVETADSGDHAISAMERTSNIDAVVLDMTMPGRNISDTYAGIRGVRAGIPIVLTSGFTEQEVIDDLLTHDATAFMQKPFSAKELVDKLCALMAR